MKQLCVSGCMYVGLCGSYVSKRNVIYMWPIVESKKHLQQKQNKTKCWPVYLSLGCFPSPKRMLFCASFLFVFHVFIPKLCHAYTFLLFSLSPISLFDWIKKNWISAPDTFFVLINRTHNKRARSELFVIKWHKWFWLNIMLVGVVTRISPCAVNVCVCVYVCIGVL